MAVAASAFDVTSRDCPIGIYRALASFLFRHLLLVTAAIAAIGIALTVAVVGANWLLSRLPSSRNGDPSRADLTIRLAALQPAYPKAPPGLGPADVIVFPPATVATAPNADIAADAEPTQRNDQVPLPMRAPAALAHLRTSDKQVAAAPALPAPALDHQGAKPAPSTPSPGLISRTAVYDISARTVFMPNGKTLEAHSGLGDLRDDPRYIRTKMRGPTPPNTYELSLRERLFHGVRAIRLTPVDDDKMYGRAGMLAHTYMLGPAGDSNGCVSFKDYPAFLQAYLKGDVDRLIVVARNGEAVARSTRAQPSLHYASK